MIYRDVACYKKDSWKEDIRRAIPEYINTGPEDFRHQFVCAALVFLYYFSYT